MCYFLFPLFLYAFSLVSPTYTQTHTYKNYELREGNCVVTKFDVQMCICILVHRIVTLRVYMKRTERFSCISVQVSVKAKELYVSHSLTVDKVLPYTKTLNMMYARANHIYSKKKETTVYCYRRDCQLSNNMP